MKAHPILIAATLLAGPLAWASTANASLILTFGQTSSSNTVTATDSGGTTTTITGSDVAVSITQIQGVTPTPTPAFLTFDLTSVGNATTVGSFVTQSFDGSFSITAGTGDTGTNYLSGTFTDAIFGENTSLTLSSSDPPDSIAFTSSVITDLGNPTGISLSFANVTPGASIDNKTLASFKAGVSGNFSGSPVPEPASLSLLGAGLLGLGLTRRRRKSV
jgi:hypothetical protein